MTQCNTFYYLHLVSQALFERSTNASAGNVSMIPKKGFLVKIVFALTEIKGTDRDKFVGRANKAIQLIPVQIFLRLFNTSPPPLRLSLSPIFKHINKSRGEEQKKPK